jgi:sugar transferase (PEP-CTERM system associated)
MIRVIKQYFTAKSALFFFTEGLLIFFSILLAVAIRFSFGTEALLHPPFFLKALLFTGICQVCLSYNDLYSINLREEHGKYNKELLKKILLSIGAAGALLVIITYFAPSFIIGRGVFGLSLIIAPFFLLIWRYLYALLLDQSLLLNEKLVIIGSGSLSLTIRKEIFSNKTLGYEVVKFIGEDSTAGIGDKIIHNSVLKLDAMNEGDHLFQLALENKVEKIIVALSERRGIPLMETLLKCKMLGIAVEDGVTFYEKITGKVSLDELKPSWLIYSDGFKVQKSAKAIKRFLDVTLSLTGLILLSPLFIILPVLIRLDSKGEIFLRQERVGENSKKFTLIKFRSMRADAEAGVGPVWAQKNDSRVTRVGKFIRKTRIDEIPQLINVLKGEMSFVGPRPERPGFVDQLTREIPYYLLRSAVKPGVTGWAQVKYEYGASIEDTRQKLQYDLYYIKNLSIFLDLAIIFSTIKVVLLARGSR